VAAYATVADFDVYGVRPRALPEEVLDSDKLAAITAASAVADSYLGAIYRLPLATWGADLRQKVCAIAAYELVATQVGFNPEAGHNFTILSRKDDAIRWLENVAKGLITPADTAGSNPPAPKAFAISSKTPRGW
jgi:phage gp36-like protein